MLVGMSMPPPMSKQDDFQLRLVQWLVDQLNSRTELETVTQQISLLISQAQAQSIEELYAHIGQLIFRKATEVELEGPESHIRLCAELCYSLSMLHFRQNSSLFPRVTLIHEHLFCLCIDSLSAENDTESVSTTSPRDDNGTLVQTSSKLLFNLWDFQLVSLVQILEYIFRATEMHKMAIGPKLTDAVIGVRSLLDSCFPSHSHSPWKSEADAFHEWIDAHSSWNESTDNTAEVGGRSRDKEQRPNPSSSNATGGPPPNLNDGPTPFNQTGLPSQIQLDEEEKMEAISGNNFGDPPQTPSTNASTEPSPSQPDGPRPGFNDREKPVPFPRSPQISQPPLAGPSTNGGQRPAGSPRMSANVPLQHQHQHPMVHPHQHHNPHFGHPMQPPPQWGGGYYYPPPRGYGPYAMYWGGPPQHQHQHQHMPQIHQHPMQPLPRTQPAQPQPPSTPPVSKTASPHPLPSSTTATLQAPPSAASSSSSVNAPTFVPGGLRHSVNPVRINTLDDDALTIEGQVPAPPKVTAPVPPKPQSVVVRMETEQQKNQRLVKEKEEKEKLARGREEKDGVEVSGGDNGPTPAPRRRGRGYRAQRGAKGG
ncbi:unnamed protein product [Rhizoctonia solani]|uniref:Uncharacterized protein n=1 Tax=Rhizoctonia solani TaxID=456999 RepID=A0A8H3DPE1_9AGAM|nr:unnamed protein product [Rhizoctonia solani]